MTSSPEPASRRPTRKSGDDLPPALSSMWRLCKLGYRHEPRLMFAAFVLSQLAVLPDALLALWLKLLGQGLLGSQPRLVRAAALGLGVSDRKSTRLNSSHGYISYAVFCLKKKKKNILIRVIVYSPKIPHLCYPSRRQHATSCPPPTRCDSCRVCNISHIRSHSFCYSTSVC